MLISVYTTRLTGADQGRSQKFILGGYNFLQYDTTVLYTSSLTTSAAISAQNNFQGLILGGYIYRYTPPSLRPWGGFRPSSAIFQNTDTIFSEFFHTYLTLKMHNFLVLEDGQKSSSYDWNTVKQVSWIRLCWLYSLGSVVFSSIVRTYIESAVKFQTNHCYSR